MKNTLTISAILTMLAAVSLGGCATTGTTTQTTANNITLDGALQKSAEIRGKVESAKATYGAAKTAQAATEGNDSSVVDTAKAAVKEKVDSAKAAVKAEGDAWANIAK